MGLKGEEICLVQDLVEAEHVGASYTSAEEFVDSGIRVSGSSLGASTTGMLISTGFDLAGAGEGAEEEWVSRGEHLAVPAVEAG